MSLFFKGERRALEPWTDVDATSSRSVTPESATYLVPVFGAFRHIIDFCSTLPIDAFRKINGERTEISPPQLISGLDDPGRPGSITWLGQAFYGIVSRGNAVGWISETDGFGYPTSVSWLQPGDWSYSESLRQWWVMGQPVASSRILHVPWIVPPGKVLGLSPIEHFAAVISAGLSAQEYADLKRGGGIPPTVLKNSEKTLNPEQSDKVKARAKRAFSTGEPFVTGKDWDLTAVTIPPNQAQFIETMKLSANQTATIYGIDPTEIGGTPGGSLTYMNEEHREIRRAADMRPYIERFEAAIDRVLPSRQFIKLNTDATVRVDLKTRTEVLGAEVADGRRSVNEARRVVDLPSIGPAGDRYNVPAPRTEPQERNPS